MHNRLVANQQYQKVFPYTSDISKAAALVEWVYELENEFNLTPKTYIIEQEHTLWVHFENSKIDCAWFIQEYGVTAAFISKEYPVYIYGATKESVEIDIRYCEQESKIQITRSDISGENFTAFTDLCLCIQIENSSEISEMYFLLSNLSPNQSYMVINRCPITNLWFANFPDKTSDTYYRYIPLQDDEYEKSRFWEDMTVDQRKELWLLLLRDKSSMTEFQHVIDSLHEGFLSDSFKWELALRQAIGEEKIEISFLHGEFRVTDRNGKRIRFDYTTGTGAERLFLKTIFPVIPKTVQLK